MKRLLNQSVFNSTPLVLLLINTESGMIEEANSAAQAFYGYSHHALTALHITKVNQDPEALHLVKALNKGSYSKANFIHQTASGECKEVSAFIFPVSAGSGRYNLSVILNSSEGDLELNSFSYVFNELVKLPDLFVEEIKYKPDFLPKVIRMANRYKAEKELVSKDFKRNEVLGKFGHWIYDIEKQMYDLSTGAQHLYGLKEKFVGREYLKSFRCSEDITDLDEAFKKVVIDKIPVEIEYSILRKTDQQVVHIRLIAELDQDGKKVFGSMRDITAEKKFEAENTILTTELRNLTGHLQLLRTEEQNNLAIAIHDTVGQGLVGLRFKVNAIKKAITAGASPTEELELLEKELSSMISTFQKIYSEVAVSFQHLSLADYIERLSEKAAAQINARIHFHSNCRRKMLPRNITTQLFSICTECLDNIQCHSKAKNIFVELNCWEDMLHLHFKDDGIGFTVNNNFNNQYGMLLIRELVLSLKGMLSINSAHNNGTEVTITIPVPVSS